MNYHIFDKIVLLLSTHWAYITQIWYQTQVHHLKFLLENSGRYQYIIQLLDLFWIVRCENCEVHFILQFFTALLPYVCSVAFILQHQNHFYLKKKVCMYKYIKNINSTSLKLLRYPVKTFISRWILFFRLGKNWNNYYVKQQQQQQEP